MVNYSTGISETVLEINVAREKVLCNFSLQGKKWKSLFIFFHAVSLLQTLLQGITGWVGKALSPQSGRQHTVTTVIWERCRLLQLTAVEEWLAQSWAGAFKYFFMTFNPQSNQNATLPSTAKHKQTLHCLCVCSAPSMHRWQLSRRSEITQNWLIIILTGEMSVILQWRA